MILALLVMLACGGGSREVIVRVVVTDAAAAALGEDAVGAEVSWRVDDAWYVDDPVRSEVLGFLCGPDEGARFRTDYRVGACVMPSTAQAWIRPTGVPPPVGEDGPACGNSGFGTGLEPDPDRPPEGALQVEVTAWPDASRRGSCSDEARGGELELVIEAE